ncbi:hypothetical protein ILYODFUR_000802 [Ilyodon furcidens]|uniref:Uncharacterized protein n=1 Tax=Ilyodon furcidens TaxID=33524 RepID=A0ABV0VA04_9TELE
MSGYHTGLDFFSVLESSGFSAAESLPWRNVIGRSESLLGVGGAPALCVCSALTEEGQLPSAAEESEEELLPECVKRWLEPEFYFQFSVQTALLETWRETRRVTLSAKAVGGVYS